MFYTRSFRKWLTLPLCCLLAMQIKFYQAGLYNYELYIRKMCKISTQLEQRTHNDILPFILTPILPRCMQDNPRSRTQHIMCVPLQIQEHWVPPVHKCWSRPAVVCNSSRCKQESDIWEMGKLFGDLQCVLYFGEHSFEIWDGHQI